MKYCISILLFLNICSPLFSQDSGHSFFTVQNVMKAQIPDSIIIGKGGASAILKNGAFYFVDNDAHIVRFFSKEGKLIHSFGNEGRGPGEFFDVTDIYIANHALYLFDYKNARIQQFDLDGRFIKTINLKSPFYVNSEFIVTDNEIQVLGSQAKNDLFIHRFNLKGNYLGSFGKFIDFSTFLINPNGKLQLTQLNAAVDKNGIIYTVAAPYRMFFYDKKRRLVWKKTDPILPKPWEGYIKITPTSYTAKYYPAVFNSLILDEKKFVVYWLDATKKQCFFDLRSLKDGKLIARSEFDFNMAPIALATNNKGNLLVLAKNRENYDLFLYTLSINPNVTK